jgi:hypothetical protein
MDMKYPKKTFGGERWKRRFFVLTNDAFHCFKREEEDSSLFGEVPTYLYHTIPYHTITNISGTGRWGHDIVVTPNRHVKQYH